MLYFISHCSEQNTERQKSRHDENTTNHERYEVKGVGLPGMVINIRVQSSFITVNHFISLICCFY